jgi:hypothetical protein
MKKQIVYILFLIGFIGFAQKPVSLKVDTTSIRIGEQINYKIIVNEVNNVVFPKLVLDSLGMVELVDDVPVDTLKNSLEKRYVLTSFDSGVYVVPQQTVLVKNAKFEIDSLLINVASVKVDTTKQKMFEIKSIKREPKTFDDYKHLTWWLIPILIVLAVLLYFIFRKKKKEDTPKIYVAPIKEALQRLLELDEKDLLKQNKVKAYYTELTDIVRTYIEKDIKIPALESTTNELIETITDFNDSSKLGISSDTINHLKNVLQSADLVKFAKSKPLIEEIKADRKTIEEVLKETQLAVHDNDSLETIQENEEISTSPIVSKKKNTKLKFILITVAIILLISSLGFFGYQYLKKNVIGSTTTEMLGDDWYTSTYGFPPITIQTPEILEAESFQLPDNGISVVGDFSIYTYGSLISNFYVAVSTTKFLSPMEDIDLEAGLNGALKGIENQLKTSFTSIKNKNIRINGIKGRKAEVEYKKLNESTNTNEDYKLTMLFFADEVGIRQVYVSSLWSDDNALEVVDRIINSVSLNR